MTLVPRLSKVFYSDNGSTAVEIAIKMAFRYWLHKGEPKRTTFLSLQHGYHGDTIGALSVGSIGSFHETFSPLFFKTHTAPSPYCYRCPLGKSCLDCSIACLSAMEDILCHHGEEIAAVILEPLVQVAGGIIVFPEGYLAGVRQLCDKYGVLLIADEGATGFGRTGKMFACEHERIVPDVLCLSNGITNGYVPLAVTLTTDRISDVWLGEFRELEPLRPLPRKLRKIQLACAAALASLNIFSSDETLKMMPPKVDMVKSALQDIAELPHVGDVRQKGLMVGIELVQGQGHKRTFIPWKTAWAGG